MMTTPSPNTNARKTGIFSWKYALFSFIVGLALVFGLEMLSRMAYYQRHGAYPLALQSNLVALKNHWSKVQAEKNIDQTITELQELGLQIDEEQGLAPADLKQQLVEALYSPEGADLLTIFRQQYTDAFETLVQETRKIKSLLWVLYIPDDQPMARHNRAFFRELARSHGVEYIDCTEGFLPYPLDYTTLLPENGHLSRFGNKLVVQTLRPYLERYSDYRSTVTFSRRPARLGDSKPSQNSVLTELPQIPYRVITNSQGLRMGYELTFPKAQQRILILGDSYTFGPYVSNCHTYPDLLDQQYADKEIINAGNSGYTITDELGLFLERAKYVEPDITILQVLENDLDGFFYFMRNQNDRENRTFVPLSEELTLIQAVTHQ